MIKKRYHSYVRKLGQWHLSDPFADAGKTLCGMQMLSNNWVADIPEDKRTPCKKCFEIAERDIRIIGNKK